MRHWDVARGQAGVVGAMVALWGLSEAGPSLVRCVRRVSPRTVTKI